MSYSVKESFYSLQGEGARAGRAAVFCRFSGCNLWSGEEKHRAGADCNFCDTDFVGTDGLGGGKFKQAYELADRLAAYWPDLSQGSPYVIFTGGEPLLQLDVALIDAMHKRGFEVAVETNGTLQAPVGIDWLCVSPKAQTRLVQDTGNELKLVYPQPDVDPAQFAELTFEHFYLQPMEVIVSVNPVMVAIDKVKQQDTEPPNMEQKVTTACTEYCLRHPLWKLSLQTHKTLGIR